MTKYKIQIKKPNGEIINIVEVRANNIHDVLYYVYGLEMPDNAEWKTGIIVEVFREVKLTIYQLITVVRD